MVVEIQGEKEQLQKEIGVLKSKIVELKESSKLIAEYEVLRRNNELVQEKLQSLAHQVAERGGSPSKRHSEGLLDFIREKVEFMRGKVEEL